MGYAAASPTLGSIIDKLNVAIVEALRAPVMIKRDADLGVDPAAVSPDGFAKFLADELAEMGTVLKSAGPISR